MMHHNFMIVKRIAEKLRSLRLERNLS